jgi:RNA polymerase sigma factor (sigma-70 family)
LLRSFNGQPQGVSSYSAPWFWANAVIVRIWTTIDLVVTQQETCGYGDPLGKPNPFLSRLEAAQQGDVAARDQLLEQHRLFVRQQVEKILGTKPRQDLDASDVAQEVLLGAIGSLAVFRGQDEATFCAWLKSICRNKVYAALRKKTATMSLDARTESQGALDVEALQTSIFGRVVKRHYLQQLERAISWLSPAEHQLLERRGFVAEDEVPWEAIGEELGIPAPTLRKRLSRLIDTLREGLALLDRIDRQGLDQDEATVSCLRFFQGASAAEIASRLGKPLETVVALLKRADERLAEPN